MAGRGNVAVEGFLTSASADPPADLRVLVALVGDDQEVIEEVLRTFRQSAGESRDELRQAIADGLGKAVADAAHKFKSPARSIGAARLADLCAEIEDASDAGSPGELGALMLRFEGELDALFAFLDSGGRAA